MQRHLREIASGPAGGRASPASCSPRRSVGGVLPIDDVGASGRSTRSTPARRWRRSPRAPSPARRPARRRDRLRHRRHQLRRQPRARRRRRVHARDLARRAVHRPPDRALVGRRAARSAPAAARSPGSTRAGCCASARESAGADPGPACYGRGGTRPTVTDAALVLGYLDPDRFLGGRMTLDTTAAAAAIGALAERARRVSRSEAAHARSSAVANEHMVAAIRGDHDQRGRRPARLGARRRRRRRRADDRRDRARARLPPSADPDAPPACSRRSAASTRDIVAEFTVAARHRHRATSTSTACAPGARRSATSRWPRSSSSCPPGSPGRRCSDATSSRRATPTRCGS